MKKYFFILPLVALLVFFYSYLQNKKEQPDANLRHDVDVINEINEVQIGEQIIRVEVVATPETRALGLSGRNILGEDEGMLFVFATPGRNYFWMKDMNFPIDMLWIDENLKIIYIKENAEPKSYPNTFGPNQNSKYVLEVVSGFTAKHNIKKGDSVIFTN
ncbi:hypothetical protein A2914_01940 [Candidatus Nomurabacteria bacterium RIFCSPLOWO2_01_FULL_41_21]|uniref:DUF192 domain-containing protein n=1 Tax=Candidatus Nomurabacteria bacterium RIFCSPLOWO2_01_FULL_41_21 TaxID=1801776 RepID=A0A1F6X316_9BACT|nr:MAG: hypothetical protein A2914_01940 [Candidatus Nomurabacteria bacterium RIFCSPLOWO2_01_FULL_41_21]